MESAESGQGALDRLRAVPGVTALTLAEGQIIVYEEHRPMGVYVFLSGSLTENGMDAREYSAASKPFVVPYWAEIDEPSSVTLTVSKRSHVLFVPRLAVLENADVGTLLSQV